MADLSAPPFGWAVTNSQKIMALFSRLLAMQKESVVPPCPLIASVDPASVRAHDGNQFWPFFFVIPNKFFLACGPLPKNDSTHATPNTTEGGTPNFFATGTAAVA